MKVSRNFPPTIEQQKRLFDISVGRLIFRYNSIWGLAPNLAVSVALTEDITLIVRIVIDKNTGSTTQKESDGPWYAPFGTVLDEVKGVGRVDSGDPHKTSPAKVVPSSIMLNVH
mmetsp:Transcript_1566/g.2578  ORF Transcript_1566/g.2578 Transcript_1566/m.2578 type:complete len:114 (+) Transcript_1566:1815-2156(+)